MDLEMSQIVIDDDLVMDVNTGIIGHKKSDELVKSDVFPTDEIISQIDKLEEAISDLESSFSPYSTSRLSQPRREGVYQNAGLLTNIVLGVVIALLIIILLV